MPEHTVARPKPSTAAGENLDQFLRRQIQSALYRRRNLRTDAPVSQGRSSRPVPDHHEILFSTT